MKKLQLLIAFLLLGAVLPVVAQSVITVQREDKRIRSEELNGKSAVVFKAQSSELVITTPVKDDPICDEPVKVQDGYEYRMTLDISNGSDSRVFTIALKGTTITEKTKQIQLYRNEITRFNVELVNNPITMELAPDGSHFIAAGNGWALIEFNSETQLTVHHHEALQGYVRSGRSKAGIYVDSLIINIEGIKSLNEEVGALGAKLATLEQNYDAVLETATDEELNKMDKERENLTTLLAQAEDKLDAITRISIEGDGTNKRVVDQEAVRNLTSKGKLRFNVVLLTKTMTVFQTRYAEMLHQAESYKQTRDYASAKRFYESAAAAEGASVADKQSALECAKKMGELAEFKAETDRIADRLYELSFSNKRVNKDAFFALIDDISQRYDALHRETGEEYYKQEAERLRKQKVQVGFVFKGRCVTSDYKGGRVVEEPLADVRIYGSDQSNCDEMDKRDYMFKGDLLGTSATNGTYSFTLKPGKYKTIIFEVPGDKNFKKNKHVSLEGRTGDRNVKVRFSKD